LHIEIDQKSPKVVGPLTFGISAIKVEFRDLFTSLERHDSSTASYRYFATKSKKCEKNSTIHLSRPGLLSFVNPFRTS